MLEPTFGGINLEDIKAPECFYIEEELKKVMNIPVFHDDQHGTAIISGAALVNALEVVGKKIDRVKVVSVARELRVWRAPVCMRNLACGTKTFYLSIQRSALQRPDRRHEQI